MNRQHKHSTLRFQTYPAMKGIIVLALAGLISGCESTEFDTLDASFGNSVNRMVEAQTIQPAPIEAQSAQSLDGKLGEKVYKQYRESTGKKEEVKSSKSLEIDIE